MNYNNPSRAKQEEQVTLICYCIMVLLQNTCRKLFLHKPLKPTIEGREQTSHWEFRLAPLAVYSKLVLSGFLSVGYFCSFAAKLSVLMTSDSPRGQVSNSLYSAEVSCLND